MVLGADGGPGLGLGGRADGPKDVSRAWGQGSVERGKSGTWVRNMGRQRA